MSTPGSDAELTIALAEYAHINDLRNQIDQKSSTRFNFYLALATAVAAVSAGLLTTSPDDPTVPGAAAALGLTVLIFGFAIFLRQVAFTAYSARLTASGNAIRTYLSQRAPGLQPYLLLPVGANRGAFPRRSSPLGGFAGAIGILNSAVLAVTGTVYFGWEELGLGEVLLVAAIFALSLAWHMGYVHRSRTATARALEQIAQERGL